jgi:hypothetical protein
MRSFNASKASVKHSFVAGAFDIVSVTAERLAGRKPRSLGEVMAASLV